MAFYERAGFVRLVDKERHLIIPMHRLAKMFPATAPTAPRADAIMQQLQRTAELIAELDVAALDDRIVALAEDLQRRLRDLFPA